MKWQHHLLVGHGSLYSSTVTESELYCSGAISDQEMALSMSTAFFAVNIYVFSSPQLNYYF